MSKFDKLYEATINEGSGGNVLHRFTEEIPASVIRKITALATKAGQELDKYTSGYSSYLSYQVGDYYGNLSSRGRGGYVLGGVNVEFRFSDHAEGDKFVKTNEFKKLANKVQKELDSANVSFHKPSLGASYGTVSIDFRKKRDEKI